MTREEAIKHLYTFSSTNGSGITTQEQHDEAKKMAIKALEQEPCDDAISRQYLIDIATKDGAYDYVSAQEIANAPSVRPQEPKTGHWINHMLSIECSCCGNKLFSDDENENCEDYDAIDDLGYKHCPNCGAKMVEPQESEDKG